MAASYRIQCAASGTVLAVCAYQSGAAVCAAALAVRGGVMVCLRLGGREIRRWEVANGATAADVRRMLMQPAQTKEKKE